MFFQLDQNNSGGKFITDDKVCPVLVVEAETEEQALQIASELGCYWDGVDAGVDCQCCGDRWYQSTFKITEDFLSDGYLISATSKEKWLEKYGVYKRLGEPTAFFFPWDKGEVSGYNAKLLFRSAEEYVSFVAAEYKTLVPKGEVVARIFYLNGMFKEYKKLA